MASKVPLRFVFIPQKRHAAVRLEATRSSRFKRNPLVQPSPDLKKKKQLRDRLWWGPVNGNAEQKKMQPEILKPLVYVGFNPKFFARIRLQFSRNTAQSLEVLDSLRRIDKSKQRHWSDDQSSGQSRQPSFFSRSKTIWKWSEKWGLGFIRLEVGKA